MSKARAFGSWNDLRVRAVKSRPSFAPIAPKAFLRRGGYHDRPQARTKLAALIVPMPLGKS
jgi:hypothetical protein